MSLRRLLLLLTSIVLAAGCNFKSADAYLKESRAAGEKGNYRAAIILLDKAILKNPKLKEAYIQRGLYYENIQLDDSAINDYKTLLRFDTGNTIAFFNIGLCKYRQNKFDEAIESYNNALLTKGVNNPSDTSKIQLVPDLNKNGLLAERAAFDVPSAKISKEFINR